MHGVGEGLGEVDVEGVCECGEGEEDVGEFFGDVGFLLGGFFGFGAVVVVDGAGEFTDFFGDSGEVCEGWEVAVFPLGDPVVDGLLNFCERGGVFGAVGAVEVLRHGLYRSRVVFREFVDGRAGRFCVGCAGG